MKNKETWKSIGFFVALVAVLMALRFFVISPVTVSGHSMDPTLQDGQKMQVLKVGSLKRGDIVVCQEPDEPDREIVKRLIGLPGDKVTMKDDQLTVNGKKVAEDYLEDYQKRLKDGKLADEYDYNAAYQSIANSANTFTAPDFELTVPKDSYFVLGDNRLISKDSRSFGYIKKDQMIGKAVFTYWPLNKIGLVN